MKKILETRPPRAGLFLFKLTSRQCSYKSPVMTGYYDPAANHVVIASFHPGNDYVFHRSGGWSKLIGDKNTLWKIDSWCEVPEEIMKSE